MLIMASGNCSETEIKECLDSNGPIRANIFLKKPVVIGELLQAVRNQFKDQIGKLNIKENLGIDLE